MKKLLLLLTLIIPLNLTAISSHLPTYIITGDQDNQLKYQVNIDHELIENTNVFISYTMKAKWNIYDRSSPFQEYEHNPSIFYNKNDFLCFDFIRLIPYEHASNGLAGWESQSIDRYFYEMQLSYKNIIGITEKVGGYYGYTHREGMPTARRTYGFFKTTLFLQTKAIHNFIGHERLEVTGEWTKHYYWIQAGLSFRLFTKHFSPHFYCQYYRGHGEFIGKHYKFTNAVRAGFIFN